MSIHSNPQQQHAATLQILVVWLNPEVLQRFAGRGIRKVGSYWFGDFDILEISWKPDMPSGR